MKKHFREYCKDSKECPADKICVNGVCVPRITPPPPDLAEDNTDIQNED